jgi:hypothetical protein
MLKDKEINYGCFNFVIHYLPACLQNRLHKQLNIDRKNINERLFFYLAESPCQIWEAKYLCLTDCSSGSFPNLFYWFGICCIYKGHQIKDRISHIWTNWVLAISKYENSKSSIVQFKWEKTVMQQYRTLLVKKQLKEGAQMQQYRTLLVKKQLKENSIKFLLEYHGMQ